VVPELLLLLTIWLIPSALCQNPGKGLILLVPHGSSLGMILKDDHDPRYPWRLDLPNIVLRLVF
jgi:hypothetical protein